MSSFSKLEFHRTGVGLLADPYESDSGWAIHLDHVAGSTRSLSFCSCSGGRRRTCRHLRELEKQMGEVRATYGKRSWEEIFSGSRWNRLARILFEGEPLACSAARVAQVGNGSAAFLQVGSPEAGGLLRYLEQSPMTVRFLERAGKVPKTETFADRAGLLERLSVFLRTPEEQHLNKVGLKTNRQSLEESLWYRLAYHCFREYGDSDGSLLPGIDEASGNFTLTFRDGREQPVLRIVVPRSQARSVLEFLSAEFPGQPGIAIEPLPLWSLLFRDTDELDKESRAAVGGLLRSSEEGVPTNPEVERYRYGSLVFLKGLGILAEVGRPGQEEEARPAEPAALERSRIQTFVEDDKREPGEGALILEDPMRDLRILTEYDYLEIEPEASETSSHRLSVQYGFGGQQISITELLKAKRAGLPYLETEEGWIDLNAPALRGLESLVRRKKRPGKEDLPEEEERVRLSSAELLRLKSSTTKPIRIQGPEERSAILERLLALQPSEPFVPPEGMTSSLRPYQKIGAEWLKFLYENGLGGLLCDEMGLGKTHQAMALMLVLREQQGVEEPILVVCPRTVISHWRNKLRDHAPGLRADSHHGPQRNLAATLEGADVVLTSYGLMRNDSDALCQVSWGMVILDELQQIKNRDTQAYRAARRLRARMKLGLTGTPIENSLREFKSLLDLVLPGYLGSEDEFLGRYGKTADDGPTPSRLEDLRRITSPFVLRRLKKSVLEELPDKIEDFRTCTLSQEQLELYRQAMETKGLALIEKLRSDKDRLPYIHIFALLNLLKQICDHPALALREIDAYPDYESGKWELFQELLSESLDSGQKVVVFSQYLGMIDIMERHLEDRGVEFVTLTGASRHRGEIVDRFNTDPGCRVFLGSLKAGGTGIDLVGGSVVIHYDRWWNAAREDQATDRVHRIGQKRAVQVFKLVTEGTLEERISDIIERKRRLMKSVVQIDDPKLSKIFTREELLELLRQV